jgi:ABC-type spermidine/putrescine transport system permease subunit I
MPTPSQMQLAQVIAQVTGPAFLLGSVAAFVALLSSRMSQIIARSQALNAIRDDDPAKGQLKSDIPRLRRRAVLLNKAIFSATIAGVLTCLLVVVSFGFAYLNVEHEHGVGALFIIALVFFSAALINLARESLIALHEFDYFGTS